MESRDRAALSAESDKLSSGYKVTKQVFYTNSLTYFILKHYLQGVLYTYYAVNHPDRWA